MQSAPVRIIVRYPWDRWFASRRFTAVKGVDYQTSTETFLTMVRQRAMGRFRVNVVVSDGGRRVEVALTTKQTCDLFEEN